MKRKIDVEHWERKELFNFFKDFDEPYYGITAPLDFPIYRIWRTWIYLLTRPWLR